MKHEKLPKKGEATLHVLVQAIAGKNKVPKPIATFLVLHISTHLKLNNWWSVAIVAKYIKTALPSG